MARGRRHIFGLSDWIDGWMVGCVDRDRITLFVGEIVENAMWYRGRIQVLV